MFFGHFHLPRSTRTAQMPARAGSVHAHLLANPSRAGVVVSRSDLVEPGAATCVCRGLDGPGHLTKRGTPPTH